MADPFWNGFASGVAGTSVVAFIFGLWIKSYFGPYLTQKAKNLATHEDIQKLIDQVRETERVKAEVSNSVWDHQTRLLAKKDFYVGIAEALGELRNGYVRMKALEHLRLTRDLMNPQYGPELQKKRAEEMLALEGATMKWHRATDAAPLLIPDGPYKAVREFKPRGIRFGTLHWEQDFEYNIASTQSALYHFQVSARSDLGFEPMVWKPTIVSAPPPNQNSSEDQQHSGGGES